MLGHSVVRGVRISLGHSVVRGVRVALGQSVARRMRVALGHSVARGVRVALGHSVARGAKVALGHNWCGDNSFPKIWESTCRPSRRSIVMAHFERQGGSKFYIYVELISGSKLEL